MFHCFFTILFRCFIASWQFPSYVLWLLHNFFVFHCFFTIHLCVSLLLHNSLYISIFLNILLDFSTLFLMFQFPKSLFFISVSHNFFLISQVFSISSYFSQHPNILRIFLIYLLFSLYLSNFPNIIYNILHIFSIYFCIFNIILIFFLYLS